MNIDATTVIFFLAALVIFGSAAVVAFSQNIVHSAFALLGAFAGVAVLFLLLGADFVAMIQFVVYIGGILILFLFAVMLTSSLGDAKKTSRSVGVLFALPTAAGVGALLAWLALKGGIAGGQQLKTAAAIGASPPGATAGPIGDALLSTYVLPFEIISVLLVLALVGAVILARREVKR